MAYESEYKKLLPNSDPQKRKEYWEIAKGLQQVDGLTTSKYLETVIADTLNGKYDTTDASEKISEYYAKLPESAPERASEEADKVSARITAFLEKESFKFSPVQLKLIHKELFQDNPDYNPGQYREYNIAKKEAALNGDTVRYGDFTGIEELLAYDFDEESKENYSLPFTDKQIKTLVKFTLGIWETHPFCEGNTRTISTFIIKYLRSLGAEVNNEPFKQNAQWFRDALVRANYTNVKAGIQADAGFLTMFFENILTDAKHNLSSIDLRVKSIDDI